MGRVFFTDENGNGQLAKITQNEHSCEYYVEFSNKSRFHVNLDLEDDKKVEDLEDDKKVEDLL